MRRLIDTRKARLPSFAGNFGRHFVAVKRIVANVATHQIEASRAFYGDALGMAVAMDLEWIMTFAADSSAPPQISVATEGGSGTPVPDLSIEVDDLSDVHQRMQAAGFKIEYGPVTEPWGVTRFYVRDPFGRLVNILTHE
jgi:catechol 2,3-dioxygenase-like lactoylglutathione lyase family enzyme